MATTDLILTKTVSFIDRLGFEILSHPAYYPDPEPADYHVVRSLPLLFANNMFNTHEEVENAVEQLTASKPKEFRWDLINVKTGAQVLADLV